MERNDKDYQVTGLLRLYGNIENYITSDRNEICEAIRNNPVYDNKIMPNDSFEVREDGKHYCIEELADEVVGFCGACWRDYWDGAKMSIKRLKYWIAPLELSL